MRVQTKLSLTFASVALLVAIAACVFVYLQVETAAATLTAQVDVMSKSTAYQSEYSKLTKLIEDTADEREQIASYVLDEDNMITFLAEVEQAGRALGVALTTTQLSVVEATPNEQVLNMEVSFSGSEEDALELLELFESLPYASTVERFSYQLDGNAVENVAPKVSGLLALSVTIQKHENQ
jgi:hypothetical protein